MIGLRRNSDAVLWVSWSCTLLWLFAMTEGATRNKVGVEPGPDKAAYDMHGTLFVFPHPPCNGWGSNFKVQLASRGFDPVIVAIENPLYPENYDDIRTGTVTFAELKNGDSLTTGIPCVHKQRFNGIITGGAVKVSATAEIMVHVLWRNDSFAVPPTNALDNDTHTIVTLVPNKTDLPKDYEHFFIVSTQVMPAGTSAELTIWEPNGTTVRNITLSYPDQYVFRSHDSLTGYTVEATEPIFVVQGSMAFHNCTGQDNRSDWDILMEQVRPNRALGRRYILMIPQHCELKTCNVDVTFAAFSEQPNQIYVFPGFKPDSFFRLQNTGKPLSFRMPTLGEVVKVYGDKPFHLYFTIVVRQPIVYTKTLSFPQTADFFTRDFTLFLLASVAPVEHYYQDPCYFPYRNIEEGLTVVTYLHSQKREGDSIPELMEMEGPLHFENNDTSTSKFHMCVRTRRTIDEYDQYLRNVLGKASGVIRLWYYNILLLRRNVNYYYVDGGSNVYKFQEPCTPQVDTSKLDGQDSNCNGLMDEHYLTHDGNYLPSREVGEALDLGDVLNFTERCSLHGYFLWEPFRYRLTRFEGSSGDEISFTNKTMNTQLVMLSCLGAVGLLVAFCFAIWAIDAFERYTDPNYKFHVFF